MQTAKEFWAGFRHDPRDPQTAHLRAADTDREQMHALLAEAYAEGLLSREEYDERNTSVVRARTLGEFLPLVADLLPDLLPDRTPAPVDRRQDVITPAQMQERAVAAYHRDVREALAGFLVPSLICLVIWAVVMLGGFFWPAFVMLGTGVNLIQILLRREDVVTKHREKLEKKQREQLRQAEESRERSQSPKPDEPGTNT